jgi:hypothetical protein
MKCLVLGGGGSVGVGLLYQLKSFGWQFSVVDPVRPKHWPVHVEKFGDSMLDWKEQPYSLDDLRARLTAEPFDAVVDLTPTMDKRKSLLLCDEMRVPLVNGTMVDYKEDIHIAAYNFLDDRPKVANCGHILASGMNPGALNAMAEEIIKVYEQPDAIVYWEYDDTRPHDGIYRGPSITWCPSESIAEINEDWNFEVLEEGCVLLHEDALDSHPENYHDSGVPMSMLPIPDGVGPFLIGHEESIYMGWRHDTAVKFVYGFDPENMRLIRAAGYSFKPHMLVCGDREKLIGSDIVGVSCRYDDEWYGHYCHVHNGHDTPADTNVTCMLVAAGVAASLLLIARKCVPVGAHLTHELNDFTRVFSSLVKVHEFEIVNGKAELTEIVPTLCPEPDPMMFVPPAVNLAAQSDRKSVAPAM